MEKYKNDYGKECYKGVEFARRSMKYAIEQRLRFLEFLACHYGEINRSALVDYFGISVPQASNDFKAYIKLAPGNIRYCRSEKVYRRNPEFIRVWP